MKTQQTAPSQMPLGNASPLPPDDGRPPLPEGWVWTTIGDAYEVILGQSPPSSTYNTEGIGLPFYQGKAEFGDIFPAPVKWCSQPNKIAEAGDVLISVRAPVGPTNLCRERSCIGRGLSAIRPRDEMPNLYLFYYLRCIEQDWESKATGTTFSAINGKVLREQGIPLAPLPEQQRIVAAIETQFTRLDAAVAALEQAKANLARYKASVLKAACEGRLVPTDAALYHDRCGCRGEATPQSPMNANACRGEATPQASTNAQMRGDAETSDREEPGGGCLAPTDAVADANAATRVSATDTRGIVDACMDNAYMHDACRGEATPQASTHAKMCGGAETPDREEPGGGCLAPTDAVADANATAYEPADVLLRRILAERRARWMADNPGKRYIEPTAPDTSALPDLPEGWMWATVEQVAENIQYGYTESAKDEPVGPKFLRITDIQDGKVDWSTVPYCMCPHEKIPQYLLGEGDIVFARTGATTGKSFLITSCPQAVFASYLIRLRINRQISVQYFSFFLDSPFYWSQITTVKKGSAQPGVNATILATLNIPLPPLAEQHRIVAEVERRLSVVAEVEASINANLARAARLRQAILREAFAGRLVPRGDGDVHA